MVAENFVLDKASQDVGAVAHTVQHLTTTYMVEDQGIVALPRTDTFGNFENASVSKQIQPIVNALRPNISASAVSFNKNIYRVIALDGKGISMTFEADGLLSFAVFDLEEDVTCTANATDENNLERVFFGSSDGFVYEWDVGRSHDGREIESWVKFADHYLDSQTIRKRFLRMWVDAVIEGTATIRAYAEYSAGSLDTLPTLSTDKTLYGSNSLWDIAQWDRAIFDTSISSEAYFDLVGTGDSIGVVIYHKSATDDIFTLKDVTYRFKYRRGLRSAR